MCMGCMANADFALTSGILGAASLRVGARRLLPTKRWARRVSDDEAQAFLVSLVQAPPAAAAFPANSHTADSHAADSQAADSQAAEPSTAGTLAADPLAADGTLAADSLAADGTLAADALTTDGTPTAEHLADHVVGRAHADDAWALAAR